MTYANAVLPHALFDLAERWPDESFQQRSDGKYPAVFRKTHLDLEEKRQTENLRRFSADRRSTIEKRNTKMDYILQSREQQFQPPNQTEPTPAQPGSMEKLRVMTERYRSGQPLHHPSDASCLRRYGRARFYSMMFGPKTTKSNTLATH